MKKYKKKKLSSKKLLKVFIPLVLITVILINSHRIITFYQSKTTGYEYKTIEVFHELDIYDNIKKHKHSDTLEKIIVSEYYNPKYLKAYLDITFKDNADFFPNINKLLELGYNANQINNIYQVLSNESVNIITETDYDKELDEIINLNYFHEDNLARYLKYHQTKKYSPEETVTFVNAFLDYDYYTNVIDIDDPSNMAVLVNKYHRLSSDYVPSDLEAISPKYNQGFNNLMRHDARIAFEEMCEAALADDITIYSGSAYRSYSYQQSLYNRYVWSNGFEAAETFSARAGYSEHQTGLATDVMNKRLDFISKNDPEYDWLINNSYKYGFILRYPESKEHITGYMYEEWHFRYLGKELADDLYKSGLTYEEYIARK